MRSDYKAPQRARSRCAQCCCTTEAQHNRTTAVSERRPPNLIKMNSLGSVGRSPDSTCTVNYLHCANTDTEIGIFIPSLFIYPSFWVVVFLDLEVTFHPQTDPRLQGLNGLPNFCCFGIKKSIQLTHKLKTFLKA